MIVRHKKRGTHYAVDPNYTGTMNSSACPEVDGKELVRYQSLDAGPDLNKVWYRTKDEFWDGRFEIIQQ